MKENNGNLSFRSALIAMRQLEASGVSTIVASPGLRNSPLLLAAHQTPGLKVITAVDERGGAFLALGICRGSHEPVAVLCTSGTAVANYFPAVLEANHSQLPLVVLTADRPTELVGTGANQCTDQTKIFGSHVRHYAEVGPAVASSSSLEQAGYAVARAVAKARGPTPGPVHLNLRFREPFLPADGEFPASARPTGQTWTFLQAISAPQEEHAEAVRALIEGAERPLILLGPAPLSENDAKNLARFSRESQIPMLVEAASGLAHIGEEASPFTLLRLEVLLEKMAAGSLPAPDLILRFGEPVTGRALGRLLAERPIAQLVFEEWGEAREPHLHPSIFLEGGFSLWIAALAHMKIKALESSWGDALLDAEAALEQEIDAHLGAETNFTEWHFHRALSEKIADRAAIFLGNSMPIRDFNSVFRRSKKQFSLFSNRGLSGIDGLLATAAGVAFAARCETHCVIGDLSALHDVNSLALMQSLKDEINLTVWVMNNGGGEIFRIVPTAKAGGSIEWFTTPQDYDLAALAKGFRITYARIRSGQDMADLSGEAFAGNGVRLIEVIFDPEPNLRIRKSFQEKA
ncbi:MAG: 2-succinyl-5-enolpyruvyl-6-hydroxy-3-cyclohexene-1-carboxylic-acid synthase [Bdellovibrionota bacterium]